MAVGYDEVVDFLQESVNDGSMSYEDAVAIEAEAAERYGVEDDDAITFQEAFEGISALLDEADEDYMEAMEDYDDDDDEALTESKVDSLKLRVYEAFESGKIDEDTKDTYLAYLDLENYE